jgi:hypothetical protein
MRDPKINKEKLTEKKVKIISFSTNKNLSPQKIIINYFQAINNNIEMSEKKKLIKFEREMHFMKIYVDFLCIEILIDDEQYQQQFVNLCNIAQTFMFFIDLEYEDSFQNLEFIINFIRNKIDPDNKIFIYGIYKNKNNIQNNLSENNLENYFDNQRIFYDYTEVDLNDNATLVKIFDFIIMEGVNNIKEKNYVNSNDNQNYSSCSLI